MVMHKWPLAVAMLAHVTDAVSEGSLANIAAVLQVFTPLLANACVGTLEPRAVAQPIIRLQVGWLEPLRVQVELRCIVAMAA
jgi:hypothetical protein